jgi:transposase InsO family protein
VSETSTPVKKDRKKKVSQAQTIAARRRADRARREYNRPRAKQRREAQRTFKFRVKVVRLYRRLKQHLPEKAAIEFIMERYQPRQPWHYALSPSTIRGWHRQVGQHNYAALRPQSTRPQTIHYQVPPVVVAIIFTLRHQLGWGGHRIAAELNKRQIWQVCGQSVYDIFDRLGLSVKTYALKGKSAGICYQRYEKKRPNQQWHIDLKQTHLSDGTTVYIAILIDDYSRYALAAVAGHHKTSQWVASLTQAAFTAAGRPDELVSDNGTEFCAVWQHSLTEFGKLLLANDVTHRTCAPCYPQGNGKAEAFIKSLDRELLQRRAFDSLADLQAALDRYLIYYNNYRLHSGLGWQTPASRYTGGIIPVIGLAALPGLEGMATNPIYAPAAAGPPISITPSTARNFRAIMVVN